MFKEADDDVSKDQAAQLKGKLLKLFGRLSASQTLSSKNWSKDFETCCSVLSKAVELANERLRFASLKGEAAVNQAKSRVRMSLKPLITVVRKEYEKQGNEHVDEITLKVAECLAVADAILLTVSS
ncbi:unnamed protein product [Angiostrongylus costaricensis]|uniref:I/LWEQ domain-containing protein n=1 Tax=Angiostrongylus costaricensis TaxID=334426 RepID=A0A0R3PC69_ANGCS|nr:unnamed protein product [Angiostrongylus costaricensis]